MGTHSGTQDNAGSWAGGMYAITLFAEDLAAAREFYQDVVELPLVFEDPNSAVFRLGDTLLNLLKISEARELIEPARVAGRDAHLRSADREKRQPQAISNQQRALGWVKEAHVDQRDECRRKRHNQIARVLDPENRMPI